MYFKIDDTDFSMYVNKLKVNTEAHYNSQTNASGNTVVDYINSKRTIEVGIIPLNSEAMVNLMNMLNQFEVSLSFLNPDTGVLVEGVNCILPTTNIEYYTIQTDKVMLKAFTLKFIEL